jgi:protein-disulfide isomerase
MAPKHKLTKRELRERDRQRKKLRNITIFTLIGIALAALLILPNLQPLDDLVLITPGSYGQTDGLIIGDPDALVLIEAFEDFQCPACRAFFENEKDRVLSELVATGKARFQFRHQPFLGAESRSAANASMCANEQGRFWDYHDMLFTNQIGENLGAFSDGRLEDMASMLELDVEAFNACVVETRYSADIQNDQDLALEYGVFGTPTILVNGQIVLNVNGQAEYRFPSIRRAVDAALGEAPAP